MHLSRHEPLPLFSQKVKLKIRELYFASCLLGLFSIQLVCKGSNILPPPKEERPSKPLGDSELEKLNSIKNKKQACKTLEMHILSHYGIHSLLGKDCKHHVIEDIDELNFLMKTKRYPVVTVDARIFGMFAMGKPHRPFQNFKPLSSLECKAWESQYVTVNGTDIYWINKCRKRPFLNFDDFLIHKNQVHRLQVVEEAFLDRISTGSSMPPQKQKEADFLFKLGDNTKLSTNRLKLNPNVTDSAEKLKENLKEPRLSGNRLCSKINKNVLSFYSQTYFGLKCKLRPIEGDGVSSILEKASQKGLLVELSDNEVQSLPTGKPMAAVRVWELIK